LHHAKTYYQAMKVSGVTPTSEAYRTRAFTYVREKIQEVRNEESPEAFAAFGITVVMGEAVFTAPCTVRVGEVTYRYKNAVIATGSSPRLLSVPGLDDAQVLTNQNLFTLETIPRRTLIIGAGPIGLEMGHALAMLGSEVTIATIDRQFARLEDPAIAEILAKQTAELGIRIEREAHLTHVEGDVAHFERRDGDMFRDTFTVPFDAVLVAIGRVPNIPAGIEAAGIKADHQCILVDRQYRTSNKYVYAIGDVAQRLKFTHTADDAARQVVARVVSRGWLRVRNRKAVPKVTYTLPEVAQVGLSYDEAVAKYGADRIMRLEVPFTMNDRARTEGATSGLLIVIARRLNGAVLGAHIIGPAAGELIALFTLAMDRKISLWRLRATIYAYPTYALVVKKAGDLFFARQLAELRTDVRSLVRRNAIRVVALIFWVSLIYAFHHYRTSNDLSYAEVLLSLSAFFTSTLWGPVVYMLLYALRPLILFPATLLTALSGTLFGFWWGVLFTILGENASANLAYWIGRFFGNDLRLEDAAVGNWVEGLRARPFATVLFMRLFYVPFDLTNYGSGMLKIPWLPYATATVIGIMPGLLTFVALGAAVDLAHFSEHGFRFDALDPRFVGLSAFLFIFSLVLSRVLTRWRAEM
jgi:pyruvate/2-oxoglutarate dehydrogenase complex dihydrolipoamide dehydrogenase (E3) component/uncharacterized membrane protein YdjX (TVP38/TMEM64 family)